MAKLNLSGAKLSQKSLTGKVETGNLTPQALNTVFVNGLNTRSIEGDILVLGSLTQKLPTRRGGFTKDPLPLLIVTQVDISDTFDVDAAFPYRWDVLSDGAFGSKKEFYETNQGPVDAKTVEALEKLLKIHGQRFLTVGNIANAGVESDKILRIRVTKNENSLAYYYENGKITLWEEGVTEPFVAAKFDSEGKMIEDKKGFVKNTLVPYLLEIVEE